MKPPVNSSSSWVHIMWASFTWVSLLAWAALTDLAETTRASLREMAEALKASLDALLNEARETQERELFDRPAAQARQQAWLEVATRRVNEALSIFAVRVAQGAKDLPVVREVFPDLATGITSAPIGERPRLIAQAATRLAGSPAEFAEKPALVERLREVATALQSAIEANDAARLAWTSERSEEVVAKNRLRLEMERTYGRLKALFPGRRSFVESFFRKTPKPLASDAAEGDAPTDGAPTIPAAPATTATP
jgi:hypothetical protein